MIEWDTVVVSTILSIMGAFLVGLYIRYYVKPKHEEVFNYNRKVNIQRIFGLLDNLDLQLRNFIEYFEKDLGALTVDRKTVLPEKKFEKQPDGSFIADITDRTGLGKKYEEMKPELIRITENHKMLQKSFLSDYSIYQHYMHDSFLRDIRNYIRDTTHYVGWLLKDTHLGFLRTKRMESAKKIIEYVQKDKSLVTIHDINKFIERWEKENL